MYSPGEFYKKSLAAFIPRYNDVWYCYYKAEGYRSKTGLDFIDETYSGEKYF